MIAILTWVSIVTGGLLVLLFILSLLGGLELDIDVGSTEVESDAGGLGVIKGALTFVSIASWVMKVLLVTHKHPSIAIGIGLLSGALAFLLLNYLFKLLLSNEENVNWKMQDALFSSGVVYLKIPGLEGSGIVNANIKGATRELKAKSASNIEIKTGEKVTIVDVEGEYVLVEKKEN